jgi:hypothetical protein
LTFFVVPLNKTLRFAAAERPPTHHRLWSCSASNKKNALRVGPAPPTVNLSAQHPAASRDGATSTFRGHQHPLPLKFGL